MSLIPVAYAVPGASGLCLLMLGLLSLRWPGPHAYCLFIGMWPLQAALAALVVGSCHLLWALQPVVADVLPLMAFTSRTVLDAPLAIRILLSVVVNASHVFACYALARGWVLAPK